jgi:hypothetical protein
VVLGSNEYIRCVIILGLLVGAGKVTFGRWVQCGGRETGYGSKDSTTAVMLGNCLTHAKLTRCENVKIAAQRQHKGG